MNICVLNESIWTENAQANLEELIGRTKGKKNILLIGENIYCMADRAETAAVLQKKVRKAITDSARKSRRKLQIPWHRRGCSQPAMTMTGRSLFYPVTTGKKTFSRRSLPGRKQNRSASRWTSIPFRMYSSIR